MSGYEVEREVWSGDGLDAEPYRYMPLFAGRRAPVTIEKRQPNW